MKQVRHGVFETNSSSTHSLTVCTEEEFEKWKRGEILFDYYRDCFVENVILSENDKDNAKSYYNNIKGSYWKDWEQLSEKEIESWYAKYANEHLRKNGVDDLKTYSEWKEDYDLNYFVENYTSPSGDKLKIFGKYGYC